MTCVPSKDSDQPVRPPFCSVFAIRLWRKFGSLATHTGHSENWSALTVHWMHVILLVLSCCGSNILSACAGTNWNSIYGNQFVLMCAYAWDLFSPNWVNSWAILLWKQHHFTARSHGINQSRNRGIKLAFYYSRRQSIALRRPCYQLWTGQEHWPGINVLRSQVITLTWTNEDSPGMVFDQQQDIIGLDAGFRFGQYFKQFINFTQNPYENEICLALMGVRPTPLKPLGISSSLSYCEGQEPLSHTLDDIKRDNPVCICDNKFPGNKLEGKVGEVVSLQTQNFSLFSDQGEV